MSPSTTSATTRRRTAGSSRRCAGGPASSSCTSSSSITSSPASRWPAATPPATSPRWSAITALRAACSPTACSTTASRRSGRRGRRTSRSRARSSGSPQSLVVHSRYVEDGARARRLRGPDRAHSPPRVAALRPSSRRPSGALIGCFGHVNESKRLPQLYAAFARLRERRPDARLLRRRRRIAPARRLSSRPRA